MVSDYLKQTRSLEELYALFEHEREAIAQSARSSLSIEIAKAKQRILDIDGLADSRICSDVSSATNKITSQSDAHLASVTNAVNNFHSFVQSSGIHERGSSNEDLLSSFARKTQAYIEETSADALAQINEEAHAAINKIDLMAEQSTSEIKSFQKTIEIFRDETAYATAAKIDAEEKAAADGAVLSSLTVSSELKSQITETAKGINQLAGHAKDVIANFATLKTDGIRNACDSSSAKIAHLLAAQQKIDMDKPSQYLLRVISRLAPTLADQVLVSGLYLMRCGSRASSPRRRFLSAS